MPAQSTMLSPQQLIDAAKAATIAYNEKDWKAVRAAVTPDLTYDEAATGRKVQGVDQCITLWQGWAKAFPDSRATFDNAVASGTTAVLEVTWRGTHTGPLESPAGTIPATGKRIEMRSCIVAEMAGDKVKVERQYFDMATMLRQIGVTG